MSNCKIELDLSWSKNCDISVISGTAVVAGGDNSAVAKETAKATFQINSAKFYAPVVILSISNNINLLVPDLEKIDEFA